jgi:serine O-acetyltransferase
MIRSKAEYLACLEADRRANGRPARGLAARIFRRLAFPVLCPDWNWRFIAVLRKTEYYQNCGRSWPGKLYYHYLKRRLCSLQLRLGFEIWPNCIGPGLRLPHAGPILINEACRIGSNFTINICTVIGSHHDRTPVIGDNVVVEPGAVISGGISLADGIVVGANSFVNKSFSEKNITIAGAPARKINERGARPI